MFRRGAIFRAASVFVTAGLLFCTDTVGAAALELYPHRLFLDERHRSAQVSVFNRSDQPQTYRVTVADAEINRLGDLELKSPVQPAEGERGYYGADLLRYYPRQMRLAPGEEQVIRVMARFPQSLKEGEYRAYLAVQTMPSAQEEEAFTEPAEDGQTSVEIQTLFAITIPVAITYGRPEASVALQSVRRVETESGASQLEVAVGRRGERGVYGSLEIYPADGEEPLDTLQRAVVPSSLDQRLFRLEVPDAAVQPGDRLRVVYRAFEESAQPREGFHGELGGHIKAERMLTVK